jgi:hypothetical protein
MARCALNRGSTRQTGHAAAPGPLPIKLDWRFTLLDHAGKVRMKEPRDFARQAEDQFEDAMKTWNEESTGLSEEEEAMMGDYLIGRGDNIESLLDRGYTLGILGLYSFRVFVESCG